MLKRVWCDTMWHVDVAGWVVWQGAGRAVPRDEHRGTISLVAVMKRYNLPHKLCQLVNSFPRLTRKYSSEDQRALCFRDNITVYCTSSVLYLTG